MAIQEFAIRRRIEIDAAHRVPDHGSKCFNIHGHRYVIEAEVRGPIFDAGEQKGMVMDFGFIKEDMITVIHDPCDHGMIWYKDDPMLLNMEDPAGHQIFGTGWKNYIIDCVPTAENLARIWYKALDNILQNRFNRLTRDETPYIARVLVHETPNCVAWYPASAVDPQTLFLTEAQQIASRGET